jgi:hypothetical protein
MHMLVAWLQVHIQAQVRVRHDGTHYMRASNNVGSGDCAAPDQWPCRLAANTAETLAAGWRTIHRVPAAARGAATVCTRHPRSTACTATSHVAITLQTRNRYKAPSRVCLQGTEGSCALHTTGLLTSPLTPPCTPAQHQRPVPCRSPRCHTVRRPHNLYCRLRGKRRCDSKCCCANCG